ncbi:hypothetical protein [Streptomyces sp. NRRL B-24572]|uniref:hypothetical protein n=1 Tax=Streptomyces sp. NRRL B-24572 TaxID=1962156 RepID=UPI0015C4FAD8|nr:hypothetical protein [Streptomyces sp. NRRL B-24572]
MTTTHLSSAVMTHPVRLAQAKELVARLGVDHLVVDPDPDGPPSALRTALVAWAAADPGAGHHLVVQDDVDAPAEFLETVARAAARFPDEALVYYTNRHARNGAAALAGASGSGPSPTSSPLPRPSACRPRRTPRRRTVLRLLPRPRADEPARRTEHRRAHRRRQHQRPRRPGHPPRRVPHLGH